MLTFQIPDLNAHKSDSAGKRCKVNVALPLCRGFCKTSEQGTHRFPHSHHNSSVCAPKIEKMDKIKLTDCEEGFDTAFAWIEIPVVNHCHCQALPLS
ncbi:hypothetical protein PRIPAC_75509 [Pristionchus pacificus]|uniref:Cys_knot domain-containing protein n=1 Tax=Pristionchus pacificus TaxID=54126 RepID=A0A2A6BZJ5_PRIPA|nr:hypothetical protein PRIPAC_75509 [Pristionchus pacificus]|eukprot:PDM71432.1 hypothetical protein PRIPAC_37839 [Pristionchus pacificus]